MTVYATHRNWREVVMLPKEEATGGKEIGLKFQLEEAKRKNDELKGEYEKITKELNAEKDARTQAVAKLENELKELTAARDKREKEYAALVESERKAVATMKTAQDNAAHSEKDRDELDAKAVQAREDRDNHFKEVVRLTEELHALKSETDGLNNRMTSLTADLAKAKDALRYFDINPNSDFKSKTPPRVNGTVRAVTGEGFVEISIGADDGLRAGHQLEVYRAAGGTSTYVGRIEVVKTTPDKAVCKINPKFQNSNMMKDDRVVSKIQ
jgi:vacuolar-type H+-ATPase subunit I/STV1